VYESGLSSTCQGFRLLSSLAEQKQNRKASRSGGEAVGGSGTMPGQTAGIRQRKRHGVAGAPTWRLSRMGWFRKSCDVVCQPRNRARGPAPYSIAGLRREATSVTSLSTIGKGGGERQGPREIALGKSRLKRVGGGRQSPSSGAITVSSPDRPLSKGASSSGIIIGATESSIHHRRHTRASRACGCPSNG
jgi:hypothetical protein